MSNNILSLEDRFKFDVGNKYLIRLHEHGLFRLITLNTEPDFAKVTKKIFFHSLLNNAVYQELFFDHYTQKSAGKHRYIYYARLYFLFFRKMQKL